MCVSVCTNYEYYETSTLHTCKRGVSESVLRALVGTQNDVTPLDSAPNMDFWDELLKTENPASNLGGGGTTSSGSNDLFGLILQPTPANASAGQEESHGQVQHEQGQGKVEQPSSDSAHQTLPAFGSEDFQANFEENEAVVHTVTDAATEAAEEYHVTETPNASATYDAVTFPQDLHDLPDISEGAEVENGEEAEDETRKLKVSSGQPFTSSPRS